MKNSAEQIMKDETKVFFKQKLKEYSTLSEFKKDLNEALRELKEYPEDNKHQIKLYSEVEIMLDQHIYNSETIENNKLIAEFMGAKPNKGGEYEMYGIIQNIEDGENEQHLFFSSEMKFHTDWNWLMEVVEKIENFRMKQFENSMEYSVMIEQQRCIITSETQGGICYLAGNTGGKIDVVYGGVISFIKWYNENK